MRRERAERDTIATRMYVGTKDTAARWRGRLVTVLVRSNGPGPRNALVEFDTGERVVVPTYAGRVGATLRIPCDSLGSDIRHAGARRTDGAPAEPS